MKRKSFLTKAGLWVTDHLNLLEMLAVAILLLTLILYNYTSLQYNQLIIIPLVSLAIIYYLASFAYHIDQNTNVLEMVLSKLVYLFACIGFLGIALEYVENPGARLMLLIGGIGVLGSLIVMTVMLLIKRASFPAGQIIRSLIFTILFTFIYLIAYGYVI